ncbi:MAG: glycosyltransferase family 4 protein [Candidatus Hinthialibacter antarcticus]|nr:glycosyltransferase family 4 protein [Candidatus Hinthialibacter antarcticus]
MISFQSKPRIAFIDLTFNWPPVGGCWIDLHHVMQGLQSRGADVCLFTPDFSTYYPRGQVKTAMSYPIVGIPFNRYTYNYATVMKRFRHCVENFQPDLIFIGDGYHMKNHLMTALGPQNCFLRFYAYEMLCINLHYYRYHEGRVCDQGYFENPRECHRCWFHRMPAVGRAAQIAVGWPERHPNLHFSQEYLASLAFTEGYRRKLLENFSQLAGAVVYNPFMRGKLEAYIPTIHTIPSGVDPTRFTPPEMKPDHSVVKIFLPGRANDPLKGLGVLIDACDQLQKEGLAFEVHYTAAMDCPAQRPWLRNRGWTGPDELPQLYHEMDIVAAPSTWIEPFGITALEGMASGLPVVASNAGGFAQTVVDNQTGKHFESGSARSLANALRPLIADDELRDALGRNGRERVLQQYAWDRILDERYVPLIESHLASNQRTTS